MFKTRQFFFFFLFTLACVSARGQFAAKDRMFSGSFNMGFDNYTSKTNAEQSNQFKLRFNPQMSFFTSAHWAFGFGLDAQFSHQNRTQRGFSRDQSKNNDIQCTPQLIGQYYHAFSEKWYGVARFQIEPVRIRFSQWTTLFSTGQSFKGPYTFQKNYESSFWFAPQIGYHASKHWLLEGQLGNLSLTVNRNNTYRSFFVNGQLQPTFFNLRGIYLWSKTPRSPQPQRGVSQ